MNARSSLLPILAALLLTPSSAAAAEVFEVVGTITATRYQDLFGSARQTALGHAELTGGRGVEQFWTNPGATARDHAGAEFAVAWQPDHQIVVGSEEASLTSFAAQVQRGPWAIGLGTRGVDSSIRIRTAFDPAGREEEFSQRDVSALAVVALDHWWAEDSPWSWSAGAAWRHRSQNLGGLELEADTVDLGTTAGWTRRVEGAELGLAAGLALVNAFGAENVTDGRVRPWPRCWRAGLTLEVTLTGAPGERAWIATRSSWAITRELEGDEDDATHWGIEIVALEHLFFRVGHDGQSYGGADGIGIGGRAPLGELASVELDWTRFSYDWFGSEVDEDVWGGRIAAAF